MLGSGHLISLDYAAPYFLTFGTPIGPPNFAPALAQQNLQPIECGRRRGNPLRRINDFRQG